MSKSSTLAHGVHGALAHPLAVQHTERLQRNMSPVGEHAWCLVGNGLSNQTFVRAPEGIIAIDSGESVEEMQDAIDELRKFTAEPIIACIYSHFHYVNGTQAILNDGVAHPAPAPLQIFGHELIAANLNRFGGEIAPRVSRGIVHQFGLLLPDEGDDALLHCGLGLFFRNPNHAPFTPGYIPAQHTLTTELHTQIGGLQVSLSHAPSDANDSITIWFPELEVCVNNLVWPSLFNIFAIRGEEYRDPRILLTGIDAINALQPQHLIGTHGPPLSGADIQPAVTDYRDAIQYIWDQTVRGANLGLRLDEITQQVQLPEHFNRSFYTQQLYGLAEHHVRQVYSGLFGWLDEDESKLLPLPDNTRAARLIQGFGGHEKVRSQAQLALDQQDLRWAMELATWLVRVDEPTTQDKQLLAHILREHAQHTTSANVRNWCLTRALYWEDKVNLQRFTQHRFHYEDVLKATPQHYISTLRVLLDPSKTLDWQDEVAWRFASGERAGLKIRSGVAIPTNGEQAQLSMSLSHETWAAILSGRTTLQAAEEASQVSVHGDRSRITRFFNAFDHPSLG